MNSSILSFLIALGLPGTSACNAQQGGLPRVGQAPPVAELPVTTHAGSISDADEESDEDMDDVDVDDVDMDEQDLQESEAATELDEAELEQQLAVQEQQAAQQERALSSLFGDEHARALAHADGQGLARVAPQVESRCEARCQSSAPACGQGSCETRVEVSGPLGSTHALSVGPDGSVVLDGRTLELRTARPGSTIEFDTKDGQHIIVRSQSQSGNKAEGGLLEPGRYQLGSLPMLHSALAAKSQSGQTSEARVRELEARVRELEARLAERDGGRSAPQARAFSPTTPQGGWLAPEQRQELETRAARSGNWARAYSDDARKAVEQARKAGEQARKAGEQARKQAEVYRKQALDSATRAAQRAAQQRWRVFSGGGAAGGSRADAGGSVDAFGGNSGVFMAPTPFAGQPTTPVPSCAGTAPAAPDIAEPGMPGALAPAAVPTPAADFAPSPAQLPTQPSAPGAMPASPRAEELRAMMDEMRAQMQEMRKQMKVLREELDQAPRHADPLPR